MIAVLSLGLGGCPGKLEVPIMIAAPKPELQFPAECTVPSEPEPAPLASATSRGMTEAQAAREHRRALLWGRDLAGQRMVCRAWISAYVAERWPAKVERARVARVD